MRENPLWYICGGPKNNGRFAYFENNWLLIGLNHLPSTKNARMRMFRLHAQQDRRASYGRNR